ncbi:MAG TPA: hemerythrin domain-containing protein [Phycisphaerae bacterium]|nr:hemerythrin domain-containing protein [Phycisphaerae bacterium]
MKSDDLAQWMRQEHDRVEDLAGVLLKEVAAPPRTQVQEWLTHLRDRFDHMRAHLQKHMALEEQDGYLPSVVEQRPTLFDQVERLKHEHGEITRIMDGIHTALHEAGPDDRMLVRECCQRIENVLTEVQRHEADENLMVMSAFTRDIGANG